MTLTIPDEALEDSGMSERDLLVEIACRLFDAGKLSKWRASRMVGMTRDEFNAELGDRGLAVIHYTAEDLDRELETIRRLEESGFWKKRA
jgi:predicted HTH domain antitoxin